MSTVPEKECTNYLWIIVDRLEKENTYKERVHVVQNRPNTQLHGI